MSKICILPAEGGENTYLSSYSNIYIDVTKFMDIWLEIVTCYEQFKNTTAKFPYIENYQAIAKIRGVESNYNYACAFNSSPLRKTQCLDFLP